MSKISVNIAYTMQLKLKLQCDTVNNEHSEKESKDHDQRTKNTLATDKQEEVYACNCKRTGKPTYDFPCFCRTILGRKKLSSHVFYIYNAPMSRPSNLKTKQKKFSNRLGYYKSTMRPVPSMRKKESTRLDIQANSRAKNIGVICIHDLDIQRHQFAIGK